MKTSRSKVSRTVARAVSGRASFVAVASTLVAAASASAASGPAGHAPIGVMADHTHHAGEVMFSYRYMRMGMNGLRDDDERISRSRVLDDFPVTPTSMDMEMHMFGAMYAPVERLTLMLMVPYVALAMDHRTRTGVEFTTRSEGIGDIRALALVDLYRSRPAGTSHGAPGGGHGGARLHAGIQHAVHGMIGVRFPTGSISEIDVTPASAGAKVRLPYPMQTGSGTYDLLPGLTYRGDRAAISWGAQARGEIRLNENHAQYRTGNAYAATVWGAYELSSWLSASLRFEWLHQLNHRGRDRSLNPAMVPTADPGRRAVKRLDALVGLNVKLPFEALSGLRLAIEAGLPAYQHLDGPGLETDWLTTVGVQYAFD